MLAAPLLVCAGNGMCWGDLCCVGFLGFVPGDLMWFGWLGCLSDVFFFDYADRCFELFDCMGLWVCLFWGFWLPLGVAGVSGMNLRV